MTAILAYSSPERQIKEIMGIIKPMLAAQGIEFEMDWPHITIVYLTKPTKELKRALLDLAHEEIPTFKIKDIAVFAGRDPANRYYLVLLLDSPPVYTDVKRKVQEVAGLVPKSHDPHVSLFNVSSEHKDKLVSLLPKIREAIKNKLYPIRPEQAQIWEERGVTEVKGHILRALACLLKS